LEAFHWCAIRDTPPNSKNWQRWERVALEPSLNAEMSWTGDYAVKKVTIVGETTEESFSKDSSASGSEDFGGVDPKHCAITRHG
jgi:hypothetical protein